MIVCSSRWDYFTSKILCAFLWSVWWRVSLVWLVFRAVSFSGVPPIRLEEHLNKKRFSRLKKQHLPPLSELALCFNKYLSKIFHKDFCRKDKKRERDCSLPPFPYSSISVLIPSINFLHNLANIGLVSLSATTAFSLFFIAYNMQRFTA